LRRDKKKVPLPYSRGEKKNILSKTTFNNSHSTGSWINKKTFWQLRRRTTTPKGVKILTFRATDDYPSFSYIYVYNNWRLNIEYIRTHSSDLIMSENRMRLLLFGPVREFYKSTAIFNDKRVNILGCSREGK